MVVKGVCLLAVLIGRLGRHGSDLKHRTDLALRRDFKPRKFIGSLPHEGQVTIFAQTDTLVLSTPEYGDSHSARTLLWPPDYKSDRLSPHF